MVELIGLHGERHFVSAKLVERVEFYNDTVVHLLDKKFIVVNETRESINRKFNEDSIRTRFIELTKFNDRKFLINLGIVEKMEFHPETKITTLNDSFFNVREEHDEIMVKLEEHTKRINMIELTGIRNNKFILNDRIIEKIEENADIKVILINGNFYFVKDTVEEIIEKIKSGNVEVLDWISLESKGYLI